MSISLLQKFLDRGLHLLTISSCVCCARNKLEDRQGGMGKLKQDLNLVAETSRCWNLKLNPAKYMVMRFGER